MTTNGVLMFAYNNETTDYEKLARVNEKLVRKHLGVPCHIVTGTPETTNERTFRYNDHQEHVSWHNMDRFDAYNLSPFDNTLLLDVDYFIMSDNKKWLFNSSHEFVCGRRANDVTYSNSFKTDNTLSINSFPMRWATAVFFKKTRFAKAVFTMMAEIQQNYGYYAHLFHFKPAPYRNDFALSIALQILTGYQDATHLLNESIQTLSTDAIIREVKPDGTVVFEYEYDNKKYASRIRNTDLHVMNKHQVFEVLHEFEATIK